MLKIAVLDDEPECVEYICHFTEKCMHQLGFRYEISSYTDGEKLLYDLYAGKYSDIYLLDMQLTDMSGLEVARKIRRELSEAILIYITNYVEFAVEAFEVNTFRYIPKIMLKEKLSEAYRSMKPILEKKAKMERFYLIERYWQKEQILYSNIFYLKKDAKYVIIVHKDGTSRIRKTMEGILKELNAEEFLMIDRSYVVNMNQVLSIKNHQVYLRNGEILPVSKPRWKQVRQILMHDRG